MKTKEGKAHASRADCHKPSRRLVPTRSKKQPAPVTASVSGIIYRKAGKIYSSRNEIEGGDAVRALLAMDNAAVCPIRPAKLPNLLLRVPLVSIFER